MLCAHIDAFNITDGSILPNQLFNQKYGIDIKFNENIQIDEIGLDYFNVGDNDTSEIELEILTNEKSIFRKKFNIKEIYNRSIYLKINKYLAKGTYRFLFYNNDSDDLIGLFKPNYLPWLNNNKTLETINIFRIYNKEMYKTENHPFIHFSGTFQNGIDLGLGVSFGGFTKDLNGFEMIFETLEDEFCSKIGLNNYSLDSGRISVKLFENYSNKIIFEKDTIFKNYSNQFNLIGSFELKKNTTYKIQYEFISSQSIYINKIKDIQKFDNTNSINIIQFKIKKIGETQYVKDSLATAITMNFVEKTNNIYQLSDTKDEDELEYYMTEKSIFIKKNSDIYFVYDLERGEEISSEKKSEDENFEQFNIKKNKIYIIKNKLSTVKLLSLPQ